MAVGKVFIVLGAVLILLGLVIHFFPRVPFLGRLPGDIHIQEENFSFYFPFTTCLLLSAIFSAIAWLIQKKN